ncbi:MAG: processing protein [Patescibacteria group bacterium]|jgi:DNA processing protein|nr:processing protein [Patescibacteria group bacterium]
MISIEEFNNIPYRLREISDPPKKLYIQGQFPDEELKFLTVVGSRKHSSYGKMVCEKLIEKLAGYPIVIVSGMALGIDSIAHESAIKAGLKTVAIPGSGLSEKVLYPKSNFKLSRKILEAGGCLISEFEPDFKATNWSFIQRNRIGAGISDAVLLIEAEEKSGTLTTARFAIDYNREVLVVPGNISSPTSKGTNSLLRDGATPITKSADILEALGIKEIKNEEKEIIKDLPEEELLIYKSLKEPKSKDQLSEEFKKEIEEINILVSMLEIRGIVKQADGKVTRLD